MKNYEITVNGETYQVSVKEVDSLDQIETKTADTAKTEIQPSHSSVGETITAPMPGVLLRVAVNEGDRVEAGDILCVLEAMKMENEIVAPKAGTIAGVNVKSSQSVNTGEVLMTIS